MSWCSAPWLPPGVTRPTAGWRVDAGGPAEGGGGPAEGGGGASGGGWRGPAAWGEPSNNRAAGCGGPPAGPLGSRAVGLGGCEPEVPAALIKLPAQGVPGPTLVALGTVLPDLAASGVVLSGSESEPQFPCLCKGRLVEGSWQDSALSTAGVVLPRIVTVTVPVGSSQRFCRQDARGSCRPWRCRRVMSLISC